MMTISNLTLVAIITTQDYLSRTILSMEKSLERIKPARAIIICPQEFSHQTIECVQEEIKIDYSLWILENLVNYIETDFCLIQQWDSFILDESKWTDEFLKHDYIGALWQDNQVGNGGFSLRSKKFLDISQNISSLLPVGEKVFGNEDFFMCVTMRRFLTKIKGISFAPAELARQFAVERIVNDWPHNPKDLTSYNSFGFHGAFNYAAMELLNGPQ